MKIKFSSKRLPITKTFQQLKIGDTFVREWDEDMILIKINSCQYYSFVFKKIVQLKGDDTQKFIIRETELTVFK